MNINVLALGETLNLYKKDSDITFGVNDIWGRVHVDNIVCVDPQINFSVERMQIIWQSEPKKFYTHLPEWSFMKGYERIKLRTDNIVDFKGDAIPVSIVSPYVAVCLAYKLYEPETITLYGVDLVNHPKLQSRTSRVKEDFRRLFEYLIFKNCKIQLASKYGALKNTLPTK
jgi:hypothetical protein